MTVRVMECKMKQRAREIVGWLKSVPRQTQKAAWSLDVVYLEPAGWSTGRLVMIWLKAAIAQVPGTLDDEDELLSQSVTGAAQGNHCG